MMTKFNQSMYARMRAKKNESLSNLGAKNVKVMDKGASVTPATLVTPSVETVRTASPTTSVEEIPPQRKRQWIGDKEKEKADSCSSNIWDDDGVTIARAQEIFTADEIKVFSGLSTSGLVGRHLHTLVQVMSSCKFHFPFSLFCVVMRSSSPFSFLGVGEEPPSFLGVSCLGS